MTDKDINTAVGTFVDKIKEIAKHKEAAKSEQEATATVEGCPKPPKSPHKPPHKPPRKPDECAEAVKRFKHKIECALKGDHAAEEILRAVWQLLEDLGIEYHKKK